MWSSTANSTLSRSTPPQESSAGGLAGRLPGLGAEAYRDVARLGPSDSVPPVEIRFYPYASMRSTIRLRNGRIFIRISDLLEDAPEGVIGALVRILLAKLLRRRVRRAWDDIYRAHTGKADVAEALDEVRRARGRKELGPPRGRVYDLGAIFDELNAEHFGGAVDRPRIGWTLRDGWRTHGHYDAAHGTIALSRTLDAPTTPRFVVEFILYHEMLHIAIPAELRGGKRWHHTRAFRAAEASFPRMREAVAWLENFGKTRGTRRRARRSRGRR